MINDDYLTLLDNTIEMLRIEYPMKDETKINVLFELITAMDLKMSYIILNPERAKNHYCKDEGIALIKTLRSKLNLNQREAAALIGVTRESVNKWEKGKTPITEQRKKQMRYIIEQHQSPYHCFSTLDLYNSINKKNKETK